MFKKKPVKIVLCEPKNTFIGEDCFKVKKAINTLEVKVGELIDENLVRSWIKNKDNWTIEFVK
jgi:hypothetical protein